VVKTFLKKGKVFSKREKLFPFFETSIYKMWNEIYCNQLTYLTILCNFRSWRKWHELCC